MSDVSDFEKSMRSELEAFIEKRTNPGAPSPSPAPARPRRKAKPHVEPQPGLVVRLAVRMGPLSPDTEFVYRANTLSKLEARLAAEKAAHKEGWAKVGYVISIDKEES